MDGIIYLTLEQAKAIHEKTIAYSGGGTCAALDIGKLESVLEHIQNDEYYPTFVDKLTHLFFCTCQFHCFADAHVIIGTRLEKPSKINGFALLSPDFFMPERGERNHHTSTYIAGQQYESLIAIKATIPSAGDGFEGPKSL